MSDARTCGKPRKDGRPCGQNLGEGRECIWHGPGVTEADRHALALRGALAVKSRALLPASTPAPRWRSRSQIVAWLERQARLVGIGALDRQVASEMRLHAETALKAYELAGLEKLDEFERVIIHGKRVS